MNCLARLTLRVKIISQRQIARLWNQIPSANILGRLRRLERMSLIGYCYAAAIELPVLKRPIAIWNPGDWTPNLGAIAWTLRSRWRAQRRVVRVFHATSRCAQFYGGRRSRQAVCAAQISHDLGVTEMFLALRQSAPNLISLWIDEKRLAPFRRQQKLPDAVLAKTADGIPTNVFEFGGLYSKNQLRAFHDDCEARGLPYEIW